MDYDCDIVQTERGRVEYRDVGSGIPIIVLHGGHSNCRDTLCYKGLDPRKFRLIIPSRPGYGRTPLDQHQYPKKAAELMISLLDKLDIDRVIVYGISAGGPTAIELAATYPTRTNKLILASAVSKKWLHPPEITYYIARIIFHPFTEYLTWLKVRLFSRLFPGLFARIFITQMSTCENISISKQEADKLRQMLAFQRSKHGFNNDISQQINPGVLRKIECPTLIIHSKYDKSVTVDHALHANTEISNSRLEILNNKWGHLVWIGDDSVKGLNTIAKFAEE